MLDWGFVYENIPLYQQALVLTIRLAVLLQSFNTEYKSPILIL